MATSAPRGRRGTLLSAAVALLVLGTLGRVLTFTFAGAPALAVRANSATTALRGWRWDRTLTEDCRDGSDINEGYWIGEVGIRQACTNKGFRYMMRPMPDELKSKEPNTGPKLLEIGPFKIRIGEIFGGTGSTEPSRNREDAPFWGDSRT